MRPIAKWNPARDVWEVPETDNLFCEHLDVYSETWPTSGLMLRGSAYALPTSEPPTGGSACSSSHGLLFDTPDTSPERPNSGSNRVQQVAGLWNQIASLLPTPSAAAGGRYNSTGHQDTLPGTARMLSCPPRPAATPTEQDGTGTED